MREVCYRTIDMSMISIVAGFPSPLQQGLAFIPLSGRPGGFWLDVLRKGAALAVPLKL